MGSSHLLVHSTVDVTDGADDLALLHKLPSPDKRSQDSPLSCVDVGLSVNASAILGKPFDHTGYHIQVAHHVADAGSEYGDILLIGAPLPGGFDHGHLHSLLDTAGRKLRPRRHPPQRLHGEHLGQGQRLPSELTGGPDETGDPVRGPPGAPRVKVDHGIDVGNDLANDRVGKALGDRTIRTSREGARQILLVYRRLPDTRDIQ